MAVIPPESDVILLKVPIEIDEKNQLNFSDATAQYNYFNSCPKLIFDKFTYQRKDGTITVPALVDDIYGYNYVMYRNENFSNKWFYAYIIETKFLSPNSSSVKIKTDPWQTWQFDLNYKPVFVEREHVNDDTIGAHTVPEGMDVGEYVVNGSPQALQPNMLVKDAGNNAIYTEMLICFQVTELLDSMYVNTTRNINRTYSGLSIFGVESYDDASKIVAGYDYKGKDASDSAIVSIFMAPKEFFQGCHTQPATFNYDETHTYTVTIHTPVASSYASTLLETTAISRNTSIDGYVPKNNKLFTYPYNYLYMTNNVGADITYHYEDFVNAEPKFYMAGSLGQGCSIKLAPINYKHLGTDQTPVENFPYGIVGAKYPVCAWKSDYYTNWLAQNAGNIQARIVSGFASGLAMGTLYSGGNVGMGVAMAGINLVQNSISGFAEDAKAKIIPDQAHGNTNCSDVNFAWRKYFTANRMSVRNEYARIIDDFFSRFGYKINRVKNMNITGRANWNYVKTIECYIRADIPQEDLIEIQSMFNNGITIWHNPATFGDYSQNNGIV